LYFFIGIIIGNDDYINIDRINKRAGKVYNTGNYEEAVSLSKEALVLAKKHRYVKGILDAQLNIADILFATERYKKALSYYQQALITAKDTDNLQKQAAIYKGIGTCKKNFSKYKSSLNAFKRALDIYSRLNNKLEKADVEYQIGLIYKEQNKTALALKIFYRVSSVFETNNKIEYFVTVLNTIGEILRTEHRYKEAVRYLKKAEGYARQKKLDDLRTDSLILLAGVYEEIKSYENSEKNYMQAIEILERINDKYRLATAFNNLGELYRKTNKLKDAYDYYLRALKLYRQFDYKWGIAATLANMANILIKQPKIKKALKYLKEAKDIAEKKNIPQLKRFIYKSYSKAYEQKKDSDKALYYYKLYIEVNNEILNTDRISKFAEMQTKYESEKKDKELIISKLMLNRQNLISKIFLGGFIFVLFVVFLVYSRYRIKQKANTELSIINTDLNNAKKLIEKKNRHILDSIVYAKRIQNAILPTNKEMGKSLKDFFILYKPKDIVSGDFYWLFENDKKLILSVIDCTGHGVPGALMSIMGNSLLNEIIVERDLFKPDEILSELNRGIIDSFKNLDDKGLKVKDGMDVCLLCKDKISSKTYYAGAKRPLFVIKHKNELLEYRGVRKSIGELKKKKNKIFTAEEINIEKGDMVYLTSDGFVDQSDVNGKKIGSKRFREIIIKISPKPAITQKTILENELETHSGTEEQRDDISIIGVRF
jgi:serine phosphatase RsbU (regulator of sigma subunit)